jgi:hypothetical protein
MEHAVEMGAMIYITSFIKMDPGILKLIGRCTDSVQIAKAYFQSRKKK